MKQLGLTRTGIAKALGISQQTFSSALNLRSRSPSSFSLEALAEVLSVDPLWLKEGISDDPSLPRPPGLVEIPLRDTQARAGAGLALAEQSIIDQVSVKATWASQFSRSGALDDLSFIQAEGDSMQPLIHNGDQLLVDTGVTQAYSDGLFLFFSQSGLSVKRLTLNPVTQTASIKSDNPLYEDFHNIPLDEVRLAGEVVWVGRTLVRRR